MTSSPPFSPDPSPTLKGERGGLLDLPPHPRPLSHPPGGEGRHRPIPSRRSGLAGWLSAVILALLAGCGGDGRTPLVLYSPHGRDLLALFETTYEAAHPEVDVRWLDMGSQEVYDRIRSEKANPQADVWFGGPSTIFARGAAEGLLEAHTPPWATALPADGRDPGGRYFAAYRTCPVILYNSATVAAEEAPRDWEDLLEPRWRDEILIRDPLASGTMRVFFGMVLARSVATTGGTAFGFDWLRRLDAQTKEYVLNPALMIEKLVRREGSVTVWELTDALWQRQRGVPLAFVFPSSGTPIIVDAVGVVAGGPEPVAARAFVDWVGSPEAQLLAAREAFRLPARNDLSPAELPEWAREVLDAVVPADVDMELVERYGPEWMSTWDRTVRGRG